MVLAKGNGNAVQMLDMARQGLCFEVRYLKYWGKRVIKTNKRNNSVDDCFVYKT